MTKIAILDDYQNVALKYADWSQLNADITVFNKAADIAELQSFEVICAMRERTKFDRNTLAQLPNLKLLVSTGKRNAAIDSQACADLGIELRFTGYIENGAPELTWALLMALARNLITENHNFKTGGWQTTIGTDLKGKTIGIIGLGRIGQKIAAYAKAFDMKVIAWSENLTAEKAAEHCATLVSKQNLLEWSDFVTLHLVLSERSKNTIGAAELAVMKSTAYLINTSRGPLVNEAALIEALQNKTIAGAALDVYDKEPLPAEHPLRKLDNVLATPHIGYVTEDTYKCFYGDTVKAIADWLETQGN